MFESITRQAFTWESAAVFIPLGFGLLVGLVYVFLFQQPDTKREHKQFI